MLLILVTAFLSTIGFYRQAKRVGVHPGKAASVPLIAAMLMLLFVHLSGLVIEHGIRPAREFGKTGEWFQSAINLAVMLTYFFLFKRNWMMLQQPIDSARQDQ